MRKRAVRGTGIAVQKRQRRSRQAVATVLQCCCQPAPAPPGSSQFCTHLALAHFLEHARGASGVARANCRQQAAQVQD